MKSKRVICMSLLMMSGCSFRNNSPPPTFPSVAVETQEEAKENALAWSDKQTHAWLNDIPECPKRLIHQSDGSWIAETLPVWQVHCECMHTSDEEGVCWSEGRVPFGRRRYHPETDLELRGRKCGSNSSQQCAYKINGLVADLVESSHPGAGSADFIAEDGDGSHLSEDTAPYQRVQRLDGGMLGACTKLYFVHRPRHSNKIPRPEEVQAARDACESQNLPGFGFDPWSSEWGFPNLSYTYDAKHHPKSEWGIGTDLHLNIFEYWKITTGPFLSAELLLHKEDTSGKNASGAGTLGWHIRLNYFGLDTGAAFHSKKGAGFHLAPIFHVGDFSLEYRLDIYDGATVHGGAISIKPRHLLFF